MMEEEDDQNGQSSSSAFLGSRLATFQVILKLVHKYTCFHFLYGLFYYHNLYLLER